MSYSASYIALITALDNLSKLVEECTNQKKEALSKIDELSAENQKLQKEIEKLRQMNTALSQQAQEAPNKDSQHYDTLIDESTSNDVDLSLKQLKALINGNNFSGNN